MYNTNYSCIYNKKDLFINTIENEYDNLTEEEKFDIRDDLYRNDILNIFNLDNYDEEILSQELDDLSKKISSCSVFTEYILKIISENGISSDISSGIIFLFTYDNLHFFHPCICDYLLYNKISETNFNELNSNIILC
jgi:hypothetical protein